MAHLAEQARPRLRGRTTASPPFVFSRFFANQTTSSNLRLLAFNQFIYMILAARFTYPRAMLILPRAKLIRCDAKELLREFITIPRLGHPPEQPSTPHENITCRKDAIEWLIN